MIFNSLFIQIGKMIIEKLRVIYPNLFLTSQDLMLDIPTESKHSEAPEPQDTHFKLCNGIKNGFQVWQSIENGILRRMVDIRWLFDNVNGAKRYHRLRRQINSENFIPSQEKIQCGEGFQSYSMHDPFGMDIEMHLYLFTDGPVCAKLFFTGYSESDRHILLKKALENITQSITTIQIPEESPELVDEKNERWPHGKYQYEKVLKNEILIPGVGIGEKITFNHTIAHMYQTIGGGDEDMKHPFEYYFENGFFKLAIKGLFQSDNQFHIIQIRYEDDPYGSLKTELGFTIGSSRSQIISRMNNPIKEVDNWLFYLGIGFRFTRNEKVDLIVLNPINP
jgi:hypothetical protein